MRPLDCFAALAMTDRELAHLFLRVALEDDVREIVELFHKALDERVLCGDARII